MRRRKMQISEELRHISIKLEALEKENKRLKKEIVELKRIRDILYRNLEIFGKEPEVVGDVRKLPEGFINEPEESDNKVDYFDDDDIPF